VGQLVRHEVWIVLGLATGQEDVPAVGESAGAKRIGCLGGNRVVVYPGVTEVGAHPPLQRQAGRRADWVARTPALDRRASRAGVIVSRPGGRPVDVGCTAAGWAPATGQPTAAGGHPVCDGFGLALGGVGRMADGEARIDAVRKPVVTRLALDSRRHTGPVCAASGRHRQQVGTAGRCGAADPGGRHR
jgi:hypothetical protein